MALGPPGGFCLNGHRRENEAMERCAINPERVLVITPKGSTIEALPEGYYRVCWASGICQTVSGLHRANALLYWHEENSVERCRPSRP